MTNEIWVNARFLTQQKSGVQQFAIEICKELIKINTNIRFVSPKNIIHQDVAKELNVLLIGNKKGQKWEQIDLPKFLRKKNNPLLLNLCNSAPLNYRNNIITIHDLAFMENPSWFSFSFRTWYNFLIPRIVKKAKHIITVSKFSKNELENKLDVPSSKLTVIYNGLSKKLIEYSITNTNSNSREKIILTMGSLNPRKNILSLIEAFSVLNLKDYQLLIVGSENSNYNEEKFELNNKHIHFLGHIKDIELWDLYRKAELFIYPSLYEGFGIPVLEALHFKCTVLVNQLPVFKEVYTTFKPNYSTGKKSEDYVQDIKKIISEKVNSQKLPDAFLQHYSYQKSATLLNQLITKHTK